MFHKSQETKRCSRCREEKPLDAFCGDSKHGRQRYCRDCRNAYMREARSRGKWQEQPHRVKVRVGRKVINRSRKVVQDILGRELSTNEHVHHIDGNPLNDNPDNLRVVSPREHYLIHRFGE